MRAGLHGQRAAAAAGQGKLSRAGVPGDDRAGRCRARDLASCDAVLGTAVVARVAEVDDRDRVVADVDGIADGEVVGEVRHVPEQEDDHQEPPRGLDPGPAPAVGVEQAEDGSAAGLLQAGGRIGPCDSSQRVWPHGAAEAEKRGGRRGDGGRAAEAGAADGSADGAAEAAADGATEPGTAEAGAGEPAAPPAG